jgi:hypothetical protein
MDVVPIEFEQLGAERNRRPGRLRRGTAAAAATPTASCERPMTDYITTKAGLLVPPRRSPRP